MSELTGKTLGRYRVLERIGRGGMAEVYKAYQPSLDRHVAIKVLHSFLLEDEGSRERFSREARAVAALRHPHIVQVFDFDSEGQEYFMVMEYIDGPNLKARLNELGRNAARLSLDQIGGIISAIGGALGYAHRQGMIHRDVKPHNIMFTRDGQALLTDFGIAKIVSGSNISASGTLSGTPAYMSPEQGRAGILDPRTDLYSLGVVLYEMLTGQVPFDADTPFAVVIKHINEPLPLPRTLDPTIPPAMERLVFKALAKDANDRFQTADEFVQATQAAINDAAAPDPTRSTVPYARPLGDPRTTLPMIDLTPVFQHLTDTGEAGSHTDLSRLAPPALGAAASSSLHTGSPLSAEVVAEVRAAEATPNPNPDPHNPPAGIPTAPAIQGVQAKMGMGRLSCSIVVGLVGALIVLGGTAGLLSGRVGSSTRVGVIAPTVAAALGSPPGTDRRTAVAAVGGAPLPGGGLPQSSEATMPPVPSGAVNLATRPAAAATAAPPAGGGTAAQALAAQQYTAALAAYEAVLASDPRNSEALLGKAQALLGLARYQEAGDTAAQAVLNGSAADTTAAQMIRAHANMMLGNQDAANTDYNALIAAQPNNPDPLRDRAEALLALDQPSAALTDLLKANALAPNDGRTLVALGRTYATTADGFTPQPEKALDAFNRAITLNPQMAAAYAERGHFYAFIKDDGVQGLLDVSQALKIGPPTAAWYRLRADIEGGQGAVNPQLADLDQAVALDPTNPDLYHARAEVYHDQGQLDLATVQLDQAIALAPTDSGYVATRSLLRLLQNDSAGAAADAQAVITADATNPDGYSALARVQLHTGDYAAALVQAQAAVARSRPDTRADDLALRGRVYVRLEQAANAQADFTAALAVAGDTSEALLGQAELAVLRDQPAAALAALDRWETTDTHNGAGYLLRAAIAVAADEPLNARPALDIARKRFLFPDEQKQATALDRQLPP